MDEYYDISGAHRPATAEDPLRAVAARDSRQRMEQALADLDEFLAQADDDEQDEELEEGIGQLLHQVAGAEDARWSSGRFTGASRQAR